MAWVNYRYEWDWQAAGKHFERAIKLNPASFLVHHEYAGYLVYLGRSNEALEAFRKAAELDPVSPLITSGVAWTLYSTRRFDEAMEQARKALDIDPSLPPAISVLGSAYVAKGMYREAEAEFGKLAPGPRRDAYLAYLHAQLGERNQALQMLDELKGLSKQTYVPAFFFAIIYLGLGEKDQAFAWLEKAYDQRSSGILFLKYDPIWDPLRSDPRFADLLRRIGLPQ
jgi:tetratricopeptide (TPR) repeat protein